MARRSIEMHEYRQALLRLRQGDSEREIARSGLMGRAKAARFQYAHAREGRSAHLKKKTEGEAPTGWG